MVCPPGASRSYRSACMRVHFLFTGISICPQHVVVYLRQVAEKRCRRRQIDASATQVTISVAVVRSSIDWIEICAGEVSTLAGEGRDDVMKAAHVHIPGRYERKLAS